MNAVPISPSMWTLAGEILTRKQLTVLELRERHGFSWNQIAIHMNSTRSTAREHYAAATRKIYDAIEAAAGIDEALQLHALAHGPLAGLTQPRPTSEKEHA